jgi:hypothetical protein
MTTATATTPQKVNAILRKAGVPKSETTDFRGFAKADYGYSVEAHGEVVYTCTYCKADGAHRANCISVTHGASVKHRQRKVNNGTFTVRLNQRTTMAAAPDAERTNDDRAAIVTALTGAGLSVEQVNEDEWFVR